MIDPLTAAYIGFGATFAGAAAYHGARRIIASTSREVLLYRRLSAIEGFIEKAHALAYAKQPTEHHYRQLVDSARIDLRGLGIQQYEKRMNRIIETGAKAIEDGSGKAELKSLLWTLSDKIMIDTKLFE